MAQPELGVKSFQIQGFMDKGAPVDMRASAWLNTPKDSGSEAKAALEQVRGLMMRHNLSVSVVLQHRNSDDPKTWPQIGRFPLFTNKPRTDYQAPAVNQTPYASASIANDEIPF